MRTEERWDEKIKDIFLAKLPPRIRQDLLNLDVPDLPDLDTSWYIYGATNTGKTILACQMLLEKQKQNWLNGIPNRNLFIHLTTLFEKLKKEFNNNPQLNKPKLIEFYSELDLLILDDLGTVKITDWIIQQLYTIINNRYDNLKTTIITSNLSLDKIADIIEDDRITSRIERSYKILRKKPY